MYGGKFSTENLEIVVHTSPMRIDKAQIWKLAQAPVVSGPTAFRQTRLKTGPSRTDPTKLSRFAFLRDSPHIIVYI
jgi:hypothetical protein